MEEEHFLSGYCRQLDASRVVTVVIEDGTLTEADCSYASCLYIPNCPIAKQISEKLREDQ